MNVRDAMDATLRESARRAKLVMDGCSRCYCDHLIFCGAEAVFIECRACAMRHEDHAT